jgi:hypothetical protein
MSTKFTPFSLSETREVNQLLSARKACERALSPLCTSEQMNSLMGVAPDLRQLAVLGELARMTASHRELLALIKTHQPDFPRARIDPLGVRQLRAGGDPPFVVALAQADAYGRGNLEALKQKIHQIVDTVKNTWEPSVARDDRHEALPDDVRRIVDHVTFSLDEMKQASATAIKNVIAGE